MLLAFSGKMVLRQGAARPIVVMQLEHKRGMARGRNHYLKGASNNDEISPEARDLLINQR